MINQIKQFVIGACLLISVVAGVSPPPAYADNLKAQQVEFLLSQVRNTTGALAGGTVTFYAAGTTTLKTVWSDRDKATPASNPYTLDANGTAQVYADGLYKVLIKNAAGTTVYTRDNLQFTPDATNNDYYADPSAADQGATTNSRSIASLLAAIGTSKSATIVLAHSGSGNTTTYTIGQNVDWSAYTNVTFKIVPGAVISHGAYTLNIPNRSIGDVPFHWLSGAGAVTFSGNVSMAFPEEFGIDGTADQVQINQAIVAMSGLKGKVFLPKPPYYLAAPVDLTSSTDITLESIASFNNPGAMTLKLATNANCDIIDATSGALNTNIALRNLALYGNQANQNGAGPYNGLHLAGTTQNRTTVENVWVSDVKGYGIQDTQDETTFRDVKVQNCTKSGWYMNNSNDTYMYNVLSGSNDEYGFYFQGASLAQVYSINAYSNTWDGIYIENGADHQFFGGFSDNNYRNGVTITTTNASSIAKYHKFFGVSIIDNSLEGANLYSNLLLSGAGINDNHLFNGVRFFDTEDAGVNVKYLIEDARSHATYSGVPGYLIDVVNSKVNSSNTFWDTGMVTAGFFNNATRTGTIDVNTAFPLDGAPLYALSITGATYSLAPRGQVITLTTDIGGGTAITLTEGDSYAGKRISVVNIGSNNITFAESTGVQELGAGTITLGQYDSIDFIYIADRWVRTGNADN